MEKLLKWWCHLDFLAGKAAPGYNSYLITDTPRFSMVALAVLLPSGSSPLGLGSSHYKADEKREGSWASPEPMETRLEANPPITAGFPPRPRLAITF